MHTPAYLLLLRFIVFFALVYAVAAGQILLQLRRRVICLEVTRYSGLDEIKSEQRHILELPQPWLEAQGFQFVAWQQETDLLNLPGASLKGKPKALYLDKSKTVRCKVAIAQPRHGVTYSLSFSSTLRDGSEICTLNRSGPAPAPTDYLIVDGFFATDAEQLALHRQRLAGQACVAQGDFEALLARINLLHEKIFAHWLALGMIVAAQGGWRLSWSGAFRLFRLVQAYSKRLKKSPAPVAAASSAQAVAHSEKEMLQQQLAATASAGGSSRRKAWVFVLTAMVFLGLARTGFGGGWLFVLALTAVLLVHELGHFLAMKMFGYRDLSIFFLPMMGAAATGRKDNAPPWQQLIIFLAGPVPGLVLAVALMAVVMLTGTTPAILDQGSPALAQFALYSVVIAIIVNYINLLPVMPLDGGRVVELLFFSRLPRASFGFFVLCTLLLALAAAYTHDGVLWVLAVVLGINLPFQHKLMRISRILRPQYGRCRTPQEALNLLAAALAQHGQKWQTYTRVNITKTLLPRLQSGLPGWRTIIFGALVYFSMLLWPVLGVLALDPSALTQLGSLGKLMALAGSRHELRKLQADLATAHTSDTRIKANLALNLYYVLESEPKKAHAFLQAAYASIDPAHPFSDQAKVARTEYAQDLYKSKPQAAQKLYDDAAALFGSSHPDDKSGLADILEAKAQMLEAAGAPAADRIIILQQALSLRTRAHADVGGRCNVRNPLAKAYWQVGDKTNAEKTLRASVEESNLAGGDIAEIYYETSLNDLSWLLLQTGQAQAVLDLLKAYPTRQTMIAADLDDEDALPSLPHQAEAYAQLSLGNTPAAIAILSQLLTDYQAHKTGDSPIVVEASLQLDLLHARRQAELNTGAQEYALRTLLDSKPGAAETLAAMLDETDRDGRDFAQPRADTQLKLLHELGYARDAKRAGREPKR